MGKCCVHYRYVNGSCIECPKGSYGVECKDPCPDGYFGVRCGAKCNCTEEQICNAQEGCVHNNTEECPKGLFGAECKLPCPDGHYGVACKEACNCTTEQICDVKEGCVNYNTNECPKGLFGAECHIPCSDGYYGIACNETCNCTTDQICNAQEGCVHNNTDSTVEIIETTSTVQATTQLNGYNRRIHWNYIFGVLMGAVIIVLIILLVCSHRKGKTRNDERSESRDDQIAQGAGPQAVPLNNSDYADICEVDDTYSHTLTFSSDYHELSFSRSGRNRNALCVNETHYDTSKNCIRKTKIFEAESRQEDEESPYSLAQPVIDRENEVNHAGLSEIKEGYME